MKKTRVFLIVILVIVFAFCNNNICGFFDI